LLDVCWNFAESLLDRVNTLLHRPTRVLDTYSAVHFRLVLEHNISHAAVYCVRVLVLSL